MAGSIASVLEAHGAMLARIAASYEADPGRCQDLLQDISLAIWRAAPRWRGDATVRTYLARIAHNHAVNHVARSAGRAGVELTETYVDPDVGPDVRAERDQRRAHLMDAIRRLPLGQRQVVVLSLEGFSQREIAETLAVEENAVNQRLSRARRQLRAWLEEVA